MAQTYPQTVIVAPQSNQQPVVATHTTTTVVVQEKKPNACRAAIPSMHIAMAVTCLILNIFLPGVGTIVAGFAVFCCANPGQSDSGKFGTFCLNFWVGLLQLATAVFFFIGWIWAIVWGSVMIALSAEYHNPGTLTTVVQTGQGPPPPGGTTVVTTQQAPPGIIQTQPYNPQPAGGVQQPPPPNAYPGNQAPPGYAAGPGVGGDPYPQKY